MGNDRVLTVYNTCVVASLVERSQRNTKHRGEVHRTGNTAFIRADDHELVLSEVKIRDGTVHFLDDLVCRGEAFKSGCRDRVGDSLIVCIESNDVLYT